MNRYLLTSCLLLFFQLFSFAISAQEMSVNLHSGWQFRFQGKWYDAKVPGGIYKDLLRNNLIPDPYFGVNEKNLAWIDSAEWEYRTFFDADHEVITKRNIELKFSGIDTYADVYLNDSLIGRTNNQFREWTFNVRSLLKQYKNKLVIHFLSDLKRANELKAAYPLNLPGEERVHIRKSSYKFGWDFGPKFVAGGIGGNVVLSGYSKFRIKSAQMVPQIYSDSVGRVRIKSIVYSSRPQQMTLMAICKETGEKISKDFVLQKGENDLSLELKINRPSLWYPQGLGKHPLYTVILKLTDADKISEIIFKNIGFRKIELIQEKDSVGTSFYFKVNGFPVFMKGANIVPPDHFIDRSADSLWTKWVKTAVELNMNMLRVWGGGVYPPESFFEACDKYGILVWQDFMFACAMYPGNKAFLENVKAEAEEQVSRISNHPSLALWCGNNENDEGWHNWGWQKQYSMSAKDSATIWNDYETIFKKILEQAVHNYNPEMPYVSSSPQTGWGRKESLTQGDCHYWGVWWGKEPFETYAQKVPRFMSEYGFQALPDLTTIQKVCGHQVNSIADSAMKQHQKHPVGFETIEEYRKTYFAMPKNFQDYIAQSQGTQWIGLKTAITAHRLSNGRCMGTLLWQLNDTWPGISWSIVDHEGKWKYAASKIKDAFSPIAIFAEMKNDQLEIKIISDSLADLSGKLVIERFDLISGNQIEKSEHDVQLHYRKLLVLPHLIEGMTKGNHFKISLFKNDQLITSVSVDI